MLEHGVKPGLAVILVGERKDSQSYVKNKKKMAAEEYILDLDPKSHTLIPDLASVVKIDAKMPEAVFLKNRLTVTHEPSGSKLAFDAESALVMWLKRGDSPMPADTPFQRGSSLSRSGARTPARASRSARARPPAR